MGSAKAYQRAERKCKELAFTSGEDKKNQDRMTDLASKLQSKIKTYKQQIEEAEEIAALNLAKFRKAQQELEEVEERAKLAALIYASSDQNSDMSVEIRRKSDKIRNHTLRQYPHNCEDTEVAKMKTPDSRYVPVLPKPLWMSPLVFSFQPKKF